jgi:hypothetical protein
MLAFPSAQTDQLPLVAPSITPTRLGVQDECDGVNTTGGCVHLIMVHYAPGMEHPVMEGPLGVPSECQNEAETTGIER